MLNSCIRKWFYLPYLSSNYVTLLCLFYFLKGAVTHTQIHTQSATMTMAARFVSSRLETVVAKFIVDKMIMDNKT